MLHFTTFVFLVAAVLSIAVNVAAEDTKAKEAG
jgi:hypothetical protein